MKILIPTIGTRGDLQPYIALALGLQSAGHQPIVASHPVMRELVESYAIEYSPFGPNINIGNETAAIRNRSPNWLTGFLRVMKFTFNILEQSHPDLLSLCRQTDLVVVSHSGAGSIEADQLDLPKVSVTLMPQAIPVNDPREALLQRMLGKLAGAGMGLIMTRPMNQIRHRAGLKSMGPEGITSPTLNLIPISQWVNPPDPRWEKRHQLTGYWFAPSPKEWNPPMDLLRFLDAGDPPVVISLGAMAISGEDALEAAKITLAAVQQAGVRAIIQGWNEPFQSLTIPETVFHTGSIPHDWLLTHSSALVHHGGFGTTSAGLRAGIPSMAIPHIIDQFIWGQKLFELGVGPKPISRSKLTVASLADALEKLKNDKSMKEKSSKLGDIIRSEKGVVKAVGLIQDFISAV
jgi:UDP:flavonoid glycosyltransferase YjiC (YdhE family)